MFDMLKWAWLQVMELIHHDEVLAAGVALGLGIALTDAIARLLPPNMDAYYAQRLTRLIVFGTSTTAAFALNPTRLGFVLAMMVGAAAPGLQILLMRALYARFPAMKPQALVCNADDKPPPSSLTR
jgi:hypothetical protein